MSRSKILNSDKEVNAFRSNLKEQRCLQKNLSILDAEAVYSLKLIDLDNRGIRVFYKRFKDKVSRIKSHLSADDLSEMHDLEARGKMPSINKTVNISGALRIADAEKRLKIQSTENTRKVRSAHPLMRQNTRSFECLTHERGHQRPNTTGGVVERQLSSSFNARHDTSKRNSVGGMLDIAELPKGTSRSKSSRGKQIPRPGQFSQRSMDLDTGNINNVKSPKSPRSPGSPRSPQVSGPETKPASILVNSVKSIMTKIRESQNGYSEEVNDPKQNGHKKMHVRIDTESVSVCPDNSPQKTDHVSSANVINTNSLAVPRTVERKTHSTGKQLRSNQFESQDDSSVKLDKDAKSKQTNQCDDGMDIGPDRQSLSRVSNATRYSSASAGQFSCHTMQDRENTVASRLDIFSGGDDNKIGEYLGEDPYEERRHKMLLGEQERTEELLDQKDFFLERIDFDIKEMEKRNRQMSMIAPSMDIPDSVLRQVRKEAGDRAKASRLSKMRQGIHRSSISEEERKRRAQEMWKDVNKCRYLRVPSDRIDLSGIVTLASEQMKLLSAMRNVEEM